MQHSSQSPFQYSFEPLPDAREVVPGIWKITLPVPFPLRTVNVYALVGRDGWALVDTGVGTLAAREALTVGLVRAGLSLSKLQAIVLTHHHPDHIGLSGELYAQSRALVYMHPIDERNLRLIWDGGIVESFGQMADFFRLHGLASGEPAYVQDDGLLRVPPHEAFTPLADDTLIELAGEDYRVLWVPGHSDGQITLLRERDGVFLAADHVLPRITPNIGLYSPLDRPDPLGDYLHSLHKVESLAVSLALPGHGEPFVELGNRVREILQHHVERASRLRGFVAEQPQNAARLTERLFINRRLNNLEARRMALAEVLAHLEHLRYQGQLAQHSDPTEGIIYTAI